LIVPVIDDIRRSFESSEREIDWMGYSTEKRSEVWYAWSSYPYSPLRHGQVKAANQLGTRHSWRGPVLREPAAVYTPRHQAVLPPWIGPGMAGHPKPRGQQPLGERPSAFDERCIRAGGVAPPSNAGDILGRLAFPARRLARFGATPDFHQGLLVS